MIVKETDNFSSWLHNLRDREARARIRMRIRRIEEVNNFGDYKSLDGGLFELRINYGAGYRIYFVYKGNTIIVLLGGGDKSTQQKDINKARKELKCLV